MPAPVIELARGAEHNAFAGMLAELIRSNLVARADKQRALARTRGRVALVAEDAETAATLLFKPDRLEIHSGMFGIPDLTIRGSSESLIDLSRIPPHRRLKLLPDPRADVTRSLARALVQRRLRIHGLLRHASLAAGLARVLSIY